MRKEKINNINIIWFNESDSADGSIPVLWLHGWGQTGSCFSSLAPTCSRGVSAAIDFPGFGESSMPGSSWGTEQYAQALVEVIRHVFHDKVCLVGHSFGGRVAVRIASAHPELVAGIVLVGAAGLPPHRSVWKRVRIKLIRLIMAMARVSDRLFNSTLKKIATAKFGSADYAAAGAMRPILVNVVNEDLSGIAAQVDVPTLLVYGENDGETPAEMGERYNALIRSSELIVLAKFGHLDILSNGRHQLANIIRQFLRKVNKSR